MTTQTPRTTSPPWQDAIDPRLVARLLQRVTQPGVIGTGMVEVLLARLRSLQESPLLAELLQRYDSKDFFRSDHIPIVYAHPPEVSEPDSRDRVATPDSSAQSRFGQSTAPLPVQTRLTVMVRDTTRTECPIIVGTSVSLAQQEQRKAEHTERQNTATVLDQRLSLPVVLGQRRQHEPARQGETTTIVITPTRIIDTASTRTFPDSPKVIRTGAPGPQPATSLSAHGATSPAMPQHRYEIAPSLSANLQAVTRPQGLVTSDRATAAAKPSTVQHPVVTAASRPPTLTPSTLTLMRTALHTPGNDGVVRAVRQSKSQVSSVHDASRGRVTSQSRERSLTSDQTVVAAPEASTAKEGMTGGRAVVVPARELHELVEKVQQKLDIDALAEKVQRQLRRRLLVEHERRGRTRWT